MPKIAVSFYGKGLTNKKYKQIRSKLIDKVFMIFDCHYIIICMNILSIISLLSLFPDNYSYILIV